MDSSRSVCPFCCHSVVKFLQTASDLAYVDYFMCAKCLQIWNVPKGQDRPVHRVTVPTASDKAAEQS